MRTAAKVALLSLAVVLAVLATPANADLTADKLEGSWSGFCYQYASSNSFGNSSSCTPKGVRIQFPIRFNYEFKSTGGTYSYNSTAANTAFAGKTFFYAAYKSDIMKITSLPSTKPRAGCVGFKGVQFLAKVEGNTYTEHGTYNLKNEATNHCPKSFKEPGCRSNAYTYTCVATRDV